MESNPSGDQSAQPRRPPVRSVDQVVIRFCGDSGDGMQLTGSEFTHSTALAGNDLATQPDFPAEIRVPAGTPAGVSGFQLHFSSQEVFTPGDAPDVLVAMNPAALKANLKDSLQGGSLILNTGAFTAPNLKKAGYDKNPAEDGSLHAYRVYEVDITKATRTALASSGLGTKDIDRSKNFFALGLMFWLYNRPIEQEVDSINKRFAKRPDLANANLTVFKAGYHFGETAELFDASYEVKAASSLTPGVYRNITGNLATALGLVAAGRLSRLPVFLGGYPITPASDILHTLASYRHYGVTTFQAEDEIAGVGAALGASYGGSLGVTCSSGPGIALKAEAIGLAVMTELPLVIINVQRGGPSTGLPTKTEQADLLQAIYGRNGECPLPVLAAMTPSDCFEATLEACRVAIKYMTPVILLTDGYLANGSEPWKVPDAETLPPIPVEFRTDPNGYFVYARHPETRARAWVRPGTPGLEHRIGGLEKDALTGNISYDAENHDKMVRTRAAKVAGVTQEMGDLVVNGDSTGDVLVIGWGSTFGAIQKAVDGLQAEGKKVSSTHLRWLNPINPRLGPLMKGFGKVLIPEMNMGQLSKIVRSDFLVDAVSMTKIHGKPFRVSEIDAKLRELLSA